MFFSRPILLADELLKDPEEERILLEAGFSAESFMTWAVRKLKGYSVAEVDHLAKRAVNLESHEEKTDLLERIREAVKANEKKIASKKSEISKDPKEEKLKEELQYLQDHVSVLKTLIAKVQAFNIIDHLESQKNKKEEKENRPDVKVFRISDET